VSFEPAEAPAGGTVTAKVEFEMPRGWHIYGLNRGTSGVPTAFTVASGPFKVGAGVKEPTPKQHYEKYENGVEEKYDFHIGTVVFDVPIEIKADAKPGETAIELSVHYMMCTEAMCLDEADIKVAGKVKIGAAAAGHPEVVDPVDEKHAKLEARIVSVEPVQAKMGDTVIAKVELTASRGWHFYGLKKGTSGVPTAFKASAGPFQVGEGVKEPQPKHFSTTYANGSKEDYDFHEPSAVFEVPLLVTGDAKPGEAAFELTIHYMICNEVCLQPADLKVSGKLLIAAGGVAKAPAPPAGPKESSAKKDGFFAFILAAIVTGLVTLITPCVFPMIPVTISYFTKQSSGGRGGSFALAATYGIGIIVSYTAIGLIVSALLGKAGANQFAQNGWVNLVITSVFILFACSLFGWFELVLPGSITNRLSAQGRGGYVGALLLGLTFSVTAFTCAAPFLGSLILLSVQGDWTWALFGFIAYSGTMAVPFFLLGLFPQLLKKMPRSGGWLNSVKVVMGFIELGAACKFLANADVYWNWNFISRSGVLAVWTGCGVTAALYIFNLIRLENDEPATHLSVPRMLWGVAFLAISAFTASGMAGRHLGIVEAFLPLPEEKPWVWEMTGGAAAQPELSGYEETLAAAKAQKKPAFLEFTAFS
jgi:thiol:disulfide interchange protein